MAPTTRARRAQAKRENPPSSQPPPPPAILNIAEASFEPVDGAASGTPCWGKLFGPNVHVAHLFADKSRYSSVEIVAPIPTAPAYLTQILPYLNFDITWNGYGIPGRGAETSRSGDWSTTHMHFTLQNLSPRPIYVGTVEVQQGHAFPLSWGQTIQLAGQLELLQAGIAPELLQIVFAAPPFPTNTAAPIDEFNSEYRLGPTINSGQFGTVHRAVKIMGGEEHAVKVIKKKLTLMGDSEFVSVERECEVMRHICENKTRENIVRYFGTYRTNDRLYIVMEYVRGPDLLELVRQRNGLSEGYARYLLKQLIEGMASLHAEGIVHRDLKPENLLLTSDDPPILKIGDFGMAKVTHSRTFLKTHCGTQMYAAPEVFSRETKSYDNSVDVWSIGVIMFTIVTCHYPFQVDTDRYPYWTPSVRIMKINLLKGRLSPLGMDLFNSMVKDDPLARMPLATAVGHPWLRQPITERDFAPQPTVTHDAPLTPKSLDSRAWATEVLSGPQQSSAILLNAPTSLLSQSVYGRQSTFLPIPGGLPSLLSPAPSRPSSMVQNVELPTPARSTPGRKRKTPSGSTSALRKSRSIPNMAETAKRRAQGPSTPVAPAAEASRPRTRSATRRERAMGGAVHHL